MQTATEFIRAAAALPRIQLPADEADPELFDFDDELGTAAHVVAARAAEYGISSRQSMQARRELAELVSAEIDRAVLFAVRRVTEAA